MADDESRQAVRRCWIKERWKARARSERRRRLESGIRDEEKARQRNTGKGRKRDIERRGEFPSRFGPVSIATGT